MSQLNEIIIRGMQDLTKLHKGLYIDGKLYRYYASIYTHRDRVEIKIYLIKRGREHRFRPIYQTINGFNKVTGFDVYVR